MQITDLQSSDQCLSGSLVPVDDELYAGPVRTVAELPVDFAAVSHCPRPLHGEEIRHRVFTAEDEGNRWNETLPFAECSKPRLPLVGEGIATEVFVVREHQASPILEARRQE